MTDIRTDEALLRALEKAASRKPTTEQLNRQRLSFVMGALPSDSTMTREEVQSILDRQDGRKLVNA